MEFILDGMIVSNKNMENKLLENINQIYKALEYYKNDYQKTKVNNLKIGQAGNWKIIEQNKDKDSSLAKFKTMGLNVANLIEDQYYGTILNNNIYINVSFLDDFTSFQNRINIRQCIDQILNLRKTHKIILAGTKITYVTDAKDNEPFILYWYHTRDHYLVSLKKINKFLKFRYNIA